MLSHKQRKKKKGNYLFSGGVVFLCWDFGGGFRIVLVKCPFLVLRLTPIVFLRIEK